MLTTKDHEDYEDLCNALKLVIGATKQADRVVEKRRNMEIVLRIQSQLVCRNCFCRVRRSDRSICFQAGADIAEPHRRYVYEGDAMLVVGKQTKERKLFLFNDIILGAKLKKKKYEVDFKFYLKSLRVVDIEGMTKCFCLIYRGHVLVFPSEEHRLFKLIDSDNSELIFHSEDKPTWLELLNSTIKKMGMTPQEITSLKDEEESHVGDNSGASSSWNLSVEPSLSREHLAKLIVSWSTMKADDALAEVKSVAARLQQEKKL